MRPPRERGLRLTAGANALHRAVRLYWKGRSLRALRQAGTYVRRTLAGRSPPVTATLACTFRCQCSCVHCFAAVEGRDTLDELTTEEAKSALDQAAALGTLQVIFSGGEPLLRDDLSDLVAHAHALGMLTRVSTNGALLTRDRVGELKRAGLTQCGISIDDPDPAVHDRLRGLPGLFARAMEGIGHLREFGIFCKVLACASRRNVTDGLERIIDMGRRLGVTSVYLLTPVAAGRWAGAHDEVLSEDEAARVRGLLDPTFVHMELPTAGSNCCAYSRGTFYIGASGDVTPCPYVPYALGNLRTEPLADIWRRHVCALDLRTYGTCPLNDEADHAALQAHADAVRRGGPQ